jgi:hypothetical protein
LAVPWWLDSDARRRGADLLRGADMDRARRARDREVRQELSQLGNQGMLPTSADTARDIWRGTSL